MIDSMCQAAPYAFCDNPEYGQIKCGKECCNGSELKQFCCPDNTCSIDYGDINDLETSCPGYCGGHWCGSIEAGNQSCCLPPSVSLRMSYTETYKSSWYI